MYESEILKLKEMPVFSLSDVSQIVSGKEYAKKLLRKLKKSKRILRIKRDFYTFHKNPFLIATFLEKPSYISSASSLSYHNLITQIPKDIFCFSEKNNKTIKFLSKIYFIKTKYFFGFKYENYLGFKIPVSIPEKAIIDSIGVIPLSIIEEAIEKINIKTMKNLLKKIKKKSIIKRIGYLLVKKNFKIDDLKKKISKSKYIYLDPLAKKTGRKDKNWRLIINI